MQGCQPRGQLCLLVHNGHNTSTVLAVAHRQNNAMACMQNDQTRHRQTGPGTEFGGSGDGSGFGSDSDLRDNIRLGDLAMLVLYTTLYMRI
jgi:hypothetical protein